MEKMETVLLRVALAENIGDVNDCIPQLCDALGLGEPVWSDDLERYVLPWESLGPPDDVADALRTLLTSLWFEEEMESANYHSAYMFLEELANGL